MDTTTFLAQVWGVAMFAVGLGFFTSPKYYLRIYRDLEKAPLATLVFGIGGIVGGIAQINAHNIWGTVPETVITLFGWGLLVKGAVFTVLPGWVDRAGDWEADKKITPIAGSITLAIGVYLSWIGFFA